MADTPTMPPLHMIADELYSLDPSEFVARRDAWAKQARTLKQRDTAAQIKALRRPTVAASYLNRAVRAPLPALLEFLDLGEPMREAQAALSITELGQFGGQRRVLEDQVIAGLVALLRASDVQPSAASLDEVRHTLTAALADPDAEQAVRSGCLARTLSYAGFGPVDLDQALAADPGTIAPRDRSHLSVVPDPAPDPDQTPDASKDEDGSTEEVAAREAHRRRERAARALTEAQQAHKLAERAHHRLTRSIERASQARVRAQAARDEAAARRAEAQAELEAARISLAAAQERLGTTNQVLDDADDVLAALEAERDDSAHHLQQAADLVAEASRSRDLDPGS